MAVMQESQRAQFRQLGRFRFAQGSKEDNHQDNGHLSIETADGSFTCSLSADDLHDLREILRPVPESAPAVPGPPTQLRPSTGSAASPLPIADPVYSTSSDETSIYDRARLDLSALDLLPKVRRFLPEYGLEPADLLAWINDPEDEWTDESGTKVVVVRDDLAVVLGMPRQVVIAVMPRERAERQRPEHASQVRNRSRGKSGGVGKRHPTTMPEFVELAKERGCRVEHTRGGHVAVRQPRHDSARACLLFS